MKFPPLNTNLRFCPLQVRRDWMAALLPWATVGFWGDTQLGSPHFEKLLVFPKRGVQRPPE